MSLPPSDACRIAIAVVEHEGRCLVGTRGDGGPLPGLAEFPGGKCHPGESQRDAAMRECFEETGLAVTPCRLLLETTHSYAHGTLHLAFWHCRPVNSSGIREEQAGFRWVAMADLGKLDFPEANAEILHILRKKHELGEIPEGDRSA